MHLTCSQKDLSNALLITNKAVNINNTLPVLNNVLLKAEGKKLYFTTTNLEGAINYWFETNVINEGEITIPSKIFTGYINYLKNEEIDISAEEGSTVVIKTNDSVTKIKGIPATEFPPIPIIEKEGEVLISINDLKSAINQVVFAASLNTTRPILSGVYFNIDKNSLKMVATDSYRLAEKTISTKKTSKEISCIVPAKIIIELGYILDLVKKDGDINIVISKNQILFMVDEIKIISRLIEGQFPNYKQIIPQSNATKVYFNIEELSLVLKRINIFAKENNNKVIFKIEKEGVKITTDTTQYGEGEVFLKTKVEGVNNEIALNSQFILDVLSNIGDDEVIFEVGEKVNPVIVRPIKQSDYIHVIMPLKI